MEVDSNGTEPNKECSGGDDDRGEKYRDEVLTPKPELHPRTPPTRTADEDVEGEQEETPKSSRGNGDSSSNMQSDNTIHVDPGEHDDREEKSLGVLGADNNCPRLAEKGLPAERQHVVDAVDNQSEELSPQHREEEAVNFQGDVLLSQHGDDVGDDSQMGLTPGALPSEAELIAALRRHACWVCGASATSHDANISHMLTHLQGPTLMTPSTTPSSGAVPPSATAVSECIDDSLDPPTARSDFDGSTYADGGSAELNTMSAEDNNTSCLDFKTPETAMDQSLGAIRDDVLYGWDAYHALCNEPWPDLLRLSEPNRLHPSAAASVETPTPTSMPTSTPTSAPQHEPELVQATDSYQPTPPSSPPRPPQPSAADENGNLDAVDLESLAKKARIAEDVKTPAEPSVCAICLKSFPDRDELVRHVEAEVHAMGSEAKKVKKSVRSKVKPLETTPPRTPRTNVSDRIDGRHACSLCSRTFARGLALRVHISSQHPKKATNATETDRTDRPHLCTLCPKRFRRRAHLEQHRLVHSGDRPFACAHCGEAFRRKDRLVVHVRTHLLQQHQVAADDKAAVASPFRSGTSFKDKVVAKAESKASAVHQAARQSARVKANLKTKVHSSAKQVTPCAKMAASSSKMAASTSKMAASTSKMAASTSKMAASTSKMAASTSKMAASTSNMAASTSKTAAARMIAMTPSASAAADSSNKAAPRRLGAVLEAKIAALSRAALGRDAARAKEQAVSVAVPSELLTCATCRTTYTTTSRLRRHVLTCHAGTLPHVCLTCGRLCGTREALLTHVTRHIQKRVRCETNKSVKTAVVDQDATQVVPQSVLDQVVAVSPDVDVDKDNPVDVPKVVSVVISNEVSSSPEVDIVSVVADDTTQSDVPQDVVDRQSSVVQKKETGAKLLTKPKKIVFKIVSKNGSQSAATVAARFLPQLASNIASSFNRRPCANTATDRSPKVVYMVVSKNLPGAGEESDKKGGNAGVRPASRVILKVLKNSPSRSPPSPAFKVDPLKSSITGISGDPKAVEGIAPLSRVSSNAEIVLPVAVESSQLPETQDSSRVLEGNPMTLDAMPPAEVALRTLHEPSTTSHSEATPKGSTPTVVVVDPSTRITSTAQSSADQQALEIEPHRRSPVIGALRTPSTGTPRTPFIPVRTSSRVCSLSKRSPREDGRRQCEQCGRRFLGEVSYRLHLQAHGVIVKKAYACQCCGRKYEDKGDLMAHLKTHL